MKFHTSAASGQKYGQSDRKRNFLNVVSYKDEEGIKDLKSSLKLLIFPNNCQFCRRFCIRPDEADAFLVNTHPKCSPGTRMKS
jgi:hypothetical protein